MSRSKRPGKHTPYLTYNRAEWSQLRASTPLTLSEPEVEQLRGINEHIELNEVADIYLPLTRLLNLYVDATQQLYQASHEFLSNHSAKVPYIIGLAGSVAVGKSTTARIIQALLSRGPNHPKVDLITTDGFLYPNRVLEEQGILNRKGFPESYDVRRLIHFMADVKSGKPEVTAPVYSHLTYDIVPGEEIFIRQPDIIIVEGVNVLQTVTVKSRRSVPWFVSDFFDFSIYVDAREDDIRRWYIERFQTLRRTAFQDTTSFFHKFASLTEEEAVHMADEIWTSINAVNLHENIFPTRARAHLILEKGGSHRVEQVHLRKL